MRRVTGRRVASGLVAIAMTMAMVGIPVVMSSGMPRASAAATSASDVAERAGMSAGSEILWESDAQQAADLDAIAASGARWFGFDADWNSIQFEGRNAWNWVATDRLVLNARARGLHLGAGASYTPPWARGPECPAAELHCLPADPADYARFVRAAATRYGSQSPDPRLRGAVTAWSIWNEPNHQEFSQPRPDLDRYTAMLKGAYVAIKAVDPNATVITGGTAPAPNAADGTEIGPELWLRGLYARGARGYFDAVGHHPYMFPVNPLEEHSWNAFTQTRFLYDVMVANGDADKKIWGSEVGAPGGTDPEGLTDAQQAQWVIDYHHGWNTTYRAFTGPLMWFEIRDSGSDISDRWQNFGLLRQNGTPKPAYTAYQQVMGDGIGTAAGGDVSGLAMPALGRRVAANPIGGYYTLAEDGAVSAHDGAPYLGSPRLPGRLARGITVAPDGLGYLVLDGFGGVHKFGSAAHGVLGRRKTGYFGFDIARDITLTPDGRGYSVLDGYGGVHTSGVAPRYDLGYWPGWDIARSFTYSPGGLGAYLLDGFGGVHVGGNAVARKTGYWAGRDVARDLVVAPDNSGYAMVDAFGAIHRAGSAPRVSANWARWPWQHAGGIAMIGAGYIVAS